MLILKSPIILKSLSSIHTYSDRLGAKIRGNYQVIGTSITAEDLLHMTMQPSEIYIRIDNAGPLLADNSFHADNQVKLELINQFLNRIMMYNASGFTYQDEVFVTSVLNKLGIRDVNEFMRQMKVHMDRNHLITELVNKYFEFSTDISHTVNEFMQNSKYDRTELEVIKNEYHADRFIQNEIFKHLRTAECNNTIYDYNNINTKESGVKNISEISWIEQADFIQLTQMREKIFYQMNPSVWQEYNKYEVKPLEAWELSVANVTKRISMAVIENLVQKISYEESQQQHAGQNTWKNYTGIIYGSAADVLERFKDCQTYEALDLNEISTYNQSMHELFQDELQLIELLQMTSLYNVSEENQDLDADMKRNILLSVWENQNLQKQLTERLRVCKRNIAQTLINNFYYEEEKNYIGEVYKKEERYLLLRQKENNQYYAAWEGGTQDSIDLLKEMLYHSQNYRIQNEANQSVNTGTEEQIYKNIVKKVDEINSLETIAIQNEQRSYISELFSRYSDIEYNQNIPIMQNIELLDQLNQHNMYMKQMLEHSSWASDTTRKRIVVDKAKARRNALRALENPEELRQEIYEKGIAIEKELPGEIGRILSITDENTRNFYEKILGYRDENSEESIIEKEAVTQIREVTQEQFSEILNNINNDISRNDVRQSFNSILNNQTGDVINMENAVHADVNRSLKDKNEEKYVDRTFQSTLQNDIYMLLHKIQTRENVLRRKEENAGEKIEELVHNTELETDQQNVLDSSIRNIMILEHIDMAENDSIKMIEERENSMQLIHAVWESSREELADEIIESIKRDTGLRINTSEQVDMAYVSEKQLHEIKQELIKQSEEKIAQIVRQNMMTQIHTISDMVYLEFERRLKNEQRRRGY